MVETVTPTTEPTTEPAMSTPNPAPIQITYTTPAQQEGPYYPVSKPADRDNDLVTLAGASALPAGEIVVFSGTIYDAQGFPIPGAVVEIWQTDASGVYDHPGDPSTESRDRNFQFYGESITGPDGGYSFRTLLPGEYEPRPRHIHVKILVDGQEQITTQFYFDDDPASPLNIDLTPGTDADGAPILVGQRDVVLP